jgi:hypothetical protein
VDGGWNEWCPTQCHVNDWKVHKTWSRDPWIGEIGEFEERVGCLDQPNKDLVQEDSKDSSLASLHCNTDVAN